MSLVEHAVSDVTVFLSAARRGGTRLQCMVHVTVELISVAFARVFSYQFVVMVPYDGRFVSCKLHPVVTVWHISCENYIVSQVTFPVV